MNLTLQVTFVLLFVCLLTGTAHAQNGSIFSDSSFSVGYLTDADEYTNNRSIKFASRQSQPPKTYYPKDLSEYRFRNGYAYKRRTVQEGSVQVAYFLKELVSTEPRLFALKTDNGYRFFSEKEDQLTELMNDRNLAATLHALLDTCTSLAKSNVNDVRFKPESLQRIFQLKRNCYNGYLPHVRGGLTLGGVASQLTLSNMSNYSGSIEGESSTVSFGASIEAPLGLKTTNWYLDVQPNLQQTKYTFPDNTAISFAVNRSTVVVPLLFKYMTDERKFRAYVNAGPQFSWHIKNAASVRSRPNTLNSANGLTSDFNVGTNLQLGSAIGAGLEFSSKSSAAVSIELRYTGARGRGDNANYKARSIQLLMIVRF